MKVRCPHCHNLIRQTISIKEVEKILRDVESRLDSLEKMIKTQNTTVPHPNGSSHTEKRITEILDPQIPEFSNTIKTRTLTVLHLSGLDTVPKIMGHPNLLAVPNFGKKSLKYLNACLEKAGLGKY